MVKIHRTPVKIKYLYCSEENHKLFLDYFHKIRQENHNHLYKSKTHLITCY
jgi:hypothetical protein